MIAIIIPTFYFAGIPLAVHAVMNAGTSNRREGVDAWNEGRKPKFKGQ